MSHRLMGRRSRRLTAIRRMISPIRPLLHRTTPVSPTWGFERGTPIDRVYIDAFIRRHRGDIRGHTLEVLDTRYSGQFGSRVTRRDVLDVDAANPAATIVADLTRADSVPADTFDCFILTQTLQYVSDPAAAIGHAHRMLRPGGVLLATVPSIIRSEQDRTDRWRFTELSCQELFGGSFGEDRIAVSADGNILAAIAFLSGMAREEFPAAKLAQSDPRFPVVISVRAVKGPAPVP